MDLIKNLYFTAKQCLQKIVLAEGTEERTLKAADVILSQGLATIILIGEKEIINKMSIQFGLESISKATIIEPTNHAKSKEYAELLFNIRKDKGLTREQALELSKDPLYLACLMIKNGDADGEVAGAKNTTGNVLRPAFQIIKTAPGISVVSGSMLLFSKNKSFGENGVLVFSDCGVNPNPTAEELAQIAICSAKTARNIGQFEPRVAMLSFSTKGSAKHEFVDKVVRATEIAQLMDPNMQIDGELQADAAIVPDVATKKAPDSKIAGRANVLIFPDLQSGNIAYKLVQRLGDAEAIGPILQGMAAPINDLSRGCSVEDIVKMIVITANQAIKNKKAKQNNIYSS